MSEPFIVHSHIPKTGGSALNRRVLFPMHGEHRVYQMYRYVFETASRLPQRHVARAMRSFVAVGHVPFGYFDGIYPDAIYISVFREPVSRFISFLNFVLANPDHAVRQRLEPEVVANAENEPERFIEAVLSEPRLAVVHQNVQVRLAGGAPRLGEQSVTADYLDQARRNLNRHQYITGVQEEMDALIARLWERFPAMPEPKPGPASLEKRLKKTLSRQQLAPKMLDRLRSANDLDLRLYDLVAGDRSPSMDRAA